MKTSKASNKERIKERLNRPNKFELRRSEIAENALEALIDYGYAQTTLRKIAKHANVSLSSLHYYFADRGELMSYSIKGYKHQFATDLESAINNSIEFAELKYQITDIFVKAVIHETKLHRLWYDIRAQSLYEEKLNVTKKEIELAMKDVTSKIMARFEELSGQKIIFTSDQFYWILDAMFLQYIGMQLNQETDVEKSFKRALLELFDSVFKS